VTTLGIVLVGVLVFAGVWQAYAWWQTRRARLRQRQVLAVALDGLEEAPRVVLGAHPDWQIAVAKAFDGGETIVVLGQQKDGEGGRGAPTEVELQRTDSGYVIVAERPAWPTDFLDLVRAPRVSTGPPPGAKADRPRVGRVAELARRAFPGARARVVHVEHGGGTVVLLVEQPGRPAWLVQAAYREGRYAEVHRETLTDEYLRSRIKRMPHGDRRGVPHATTAAMRSP
jgi:hypothetical protein